MAGQTNAHLQPRDGKDLERVHLRVQRSERTRGARHSMLVRVHKVRRADCVVFPEGAQRFKAEDDDLRLRSDALDVGDVVCGELNSGAAVRNVARDIRIVQVCPRVLADPFRGHLELASLKAIKIDRWRLLRWHHISKYLDADLDGGRGHFAVLRRFLVPPSRHARRGFRAEAHSDAAQAALLMHFALRPTELLVEAALHTVSRSALREHALKLLLGVERLGRGRGHRDELDRNVRARRVARLLHAAVQHVCVLARRGVRVCNQQNDALVVLLQLRIHEGNSALVNRAVDLQRTIRGERADIRSEVEAQCLLRRRSAATSLQLRRRALRAVLIRQHDRFDLRNLLRVGVAKLVQGVHILSRVCRAAIVRPQQHHAEQCARRADAAVAQQARRDAQRSPKVVIRRRWGGSTAHRLARIDHNHCRLPPV